MKISQELILAARRARETAYAPYSGFCVGAALMSASARIYTGCNIENASYSATICAERSALFGAVCAGERKFEALAVVGKSGEPCLPCGVCLQALSEFCEPSLKIFLEDGDSVREYRLSDFLPFPFGLQEVRAK